MGGGGRLQHHKNLQQSQQASTPDRIESIKKLSQFKLWQFNGCFLIGDTSLMYARSADIAQILLTNGADVNAKNKKGNFVLFNNDIIVNPQYRTF